MKKLFRRCLLAACLLASAVSMAADLAAYAVVDQVQMPAWLERNGVRQPLAPGKILQNRDRVITGGEPPTNPPEFYYTGDHYETFCQIGGA